MCRTDEKPIKNMGSDDTGRVPAIVSGAGMLAPTSRPVPSTVRAQRVAVVLICIVAVALGVTCYQSGEASLWWSVGARQEGEGVNVITREPQLQAEAPNHRERATPSSSSSSKSSSHRGGGQEEDGCRRRKQKARRKPSARTEANQNGDHHDQEEEKEERECARAEGQRQRQGVGGVQDEVSASPRGPRQKMWRALRTLCGRIFRNRWGGRSGEVSASGEAEAKARIMKEFREVVGRHPGELRRRAREVRHELDDGMLVRYLDVGLWSLKAGGAPLTEAIENTLRWREEVGPHLITDRDVFGEARDGKMYVRGHDRDGRPIIFYTPALEKSFNTREELKLLYHTLEKATALLPHGQTQFAIVADCAGFGPSKVPPLEMINTAFSTLQEHYPMRLGYVIIVNASGPITFMWKLISSVLSDRTKDKIVIVPRAEAAQALGQRIDPLVLPSTLPGGLDSFRYSNEAYLSA